MQAKGEPPCERRSLKSPVLVLNKTWTAIGTSTVRHSLVAMFRGAANGLCVETFTLFDWDMWLSHEQPPKVNGTVLTVRGPIPAPEVIVLTRYDRLHAMQPSFDGRGVFIRDSYHCQYCKKRFPLHLLTVDHVLPRSRGGETSWENCVSACTECNQRKADRTPKEAGMPLPKVPAKLRWDPVLKVSPTARPESWRSLLGRTG